MGGLCLRFNLSMNRMIATHGALVGSKINAFLEWSCPHLPSSNRLMDAKDIRTVLLRTPSLWPELKAAAVFITGATGFFGIWLLETLLAANREFSLGLRIIALSRDPNAFATKAPHLAFDPAIAWITGDVRNFAFPTGSVTHVIHGAAEASARLNAQDPQTMFDVCVDGTRRVLKLAAEKRAVRMLFTSSGAIYGRQPPEMQHLPEEFSGGPDPLNANNAYASGKRAAEQLCCIAALSPPLGSHLHVSIARCFAFVGPHLPLNNHFAIGNFLRDAIAGEPIRVTGDGTPYRSYLYAADLAEWLITILLRGETGRAYNVGSEEAIMLLDLAKLIQVIAASLSTRRSPTIEISSVPAIGVLPERYVPSCKRAREELGLRLHVPLSDAISSTWRHSAAFL
jgi:nucleoside-diphosphate-sugar epimerase